MSRLFKVMVLLVALSLCAVMAANPTAAFAGDHAVVPDGSISGDDGSTVIETYGEPGESGEGDPDDGCDGIGPRSGDSFLTGFLGGRFGPDDSNIKFEVLIELMLLQFMPSL